VTHLLLFTEKKTMSLVTLTRKISTTYDLAGQHGYNMRFNFQEARIHGDLKALNSGVL